MRKPNTTPESYQNLLVTAPMGAKKNFHASLDSLANSLNTSESLSDDSHDSDSSNTDKNSFAAKCESYAQNGCGSICSWAKSDNGRDSSSEHSYEYVSPETAISSDKKAEKAVRMETIPEEGAEPKVSVKEILARFENLRDKKDKKEKKLKKESEKQKKIEKAPKEEEVIKSDVVEKEVLFHHYCF